MKTETRKFTFTCTRCGECCREEGYVFFTRHDVRRAADFLGMKHKDFIKRYLKRSHGEYSVRVTMHSPCLFLNGNECRINEAKPLQCSTFPYWDEYMDDEGRLKNFDRPCKGVKPIEGD